MKHINKILNNINSYKSKRQILFVSFAIIGYILLFIFKEKDILLSAAPVVVAVAASGGGAAAGGGAVAAGGAAASGSAAAGGAAASGSAAGSGAVAGGGAVPGTVPSAAGSVSQSGKAAEVAAKTAEIKTPPKQVSNPKVKGSSSKPSEGNVAEGLKDKSQAIDGDTTKAGQKANAESETDKAKKEAKEQAKKKLTSQDNSDDSDEDTDLEEGSDTLKKKPSLFGCVAIAIAFGFLFLLLPLLMTFIISPTTKTIKGFDCDGDSKSLACELSTGFSDFFEKAKNLFAYGKFATNGNILVEKTNEVYDKYYEEYNIKIDIPLLLSTIFADGVNYLDDIDENGNIDVNSKLRQRFNSIEDLAQLQFSNYEVTYLCILDENGNPSMQILTKTLFEGTTKKPTKSCGTTNAGEKVYRYEYQIDNSDYYEKLKKNKDILEKIYGKEAVATETDLNLLIAKIKLQKNTFDVIYGDKIQVCDSAGNIPSIAMEDPNVLLQNPLKGSYNITSYFGYRGGDYSNHKGIDVVGEKTIYAAGSGVVTRANTESMGGNVVEITHTTSDGRKFVSQYGHLKSMSVSKGDNVIAGETVIGIMGSTGTASTGVHLHFQFWEIGTNGEQILYNPLTLFVGADNYAYQCIGTANTSDTCVSSAGSIAYISKKNSYNYNLIRAIFRAKGISETSETKNNIIFTNETINYINSVKISGTIEQKTVLSNIDIIKKQIKYNDEWVSYDGNSTYDFAVRGYFIESYGKVDSKIYDYIKMGVGEIEGAQYSCLEYSSSQEMYKKWNESHHTQVEDAIKYLVNCLNLKTELSDTEIEDDATLQTYATTIASKYFGNSNPYQSNESAKLIVFAYKDLLEKGESLEALLNDCTTSNSLTGFEGAKGGQCDMYIERGACLSNIAKYDNDAYWGRFIKQAGTSLARIRLLSAAHELWGYARYCNSKNHDTPSGFYCKLSGYSDSREFDPAWSTLVGPQYGDVLGGLDCGGFITRAYTTYIRRYFFPDRYAAYDNYKPAYVLNNKTGMCSVDTEYTTHYKFGAGNLQSYFQTHTLKPGDVLCDTSGETHHVIMFIGWDDDNGNGVWNSNELMYFIHTGDPNYGVMVYSRALSDIDSQEKELIYESYFTLNDKVK